MSLINQVLLDLEKRGVQTPLNETAIRSVHRHESPVALLAGVGVLMVAIAAVAWWYLRAPASSPLPVVATAAPEVITIIPVSHPVAVSAVIAAVPLAVVVPAKREKRVIASLSAKTEAEPSAPMSGVTKRIKQITPQQQAENEYRKGSQFRQQGLVDEAVAAFENAIRIDSLHKPARQSLIGLLLENKRNDEAEQVMQVALNEDPKRTDEAMWLARLQVEKKQIVTAVETLQRSLPYASQRADYLAFLAALYQRQEQHEQAITSYRQALQLVSTTGVWWMGMAISLQAEKRHEEARAAYKRALTTGTLSPELQAYVNGRLKELP